MKRVVLALSIILLNISPNYTCDAQQANSKYPGVFDRIN